MADPCFNAACDGDLDALRAAHERGCPWDEVACVIAVVFGHVDCLAYLHEHGCPWPGEILCSMAADAGNADCLRYLHAHGCPVDADTYLGASMRTEPGHDDCLAYLHEQRVPYPPHLRTTIVRHVLLPKWRRYVHTRRLVLYWLGRTAEAAYAPGGAGRKRDRDEYEASFFS